METKPPNGEKVVIYDSATKSKIVVEKKEADVVVRNRAIFVSSLATSCRDEESDEIYHAIAEKFVREKKKSFRFRCEEEVKIEEVDPKTIELPEGGNILKAFRIETFWRTGRKSERRTHYVAILSS